MKIDRDYYACAIDHVTSYGDTDIFPFPFEIKFLADCRDKIADQLSGVDLTQYHPMSLVETLVPKSKFGFRTAHQRAKLESGVSLI